MPLVKWNIDKLDMIYSKVIRLVDNLVGKSNLHVVVWSSGSISLIDGSLIEEHEILDSNPLSYPKNDWEHKIKAVRIENANDVVSEVYLLPDGNLGFLVIGSWPLSLEYWQEQIQMDSMELALNDNWQYSWQAPVKAEDVSLEKAKKLIPLFVGEDFMYMV